MGETMSENKEKKKYVVYNIEYNIDLDDKYVVYDICVPKDQEDEFLKWVEENKIIRNYSPGGEVDEDGCRAIFRHGKLCFITSMKSSLALLIMLAKSDNK